MKVLIYLTSLIFIFSNFSLIGLNNKNPILNLRIALFDNIPPKIKEARDILKNIRKKRNIELIKPLRNILKDIESVTKRTQEFEKRHQAIPANITIDVQATILSLEITSKGIISVTQRCNSILGKLEDKLNENKIPNAELFLINENITAFTPFLLQKFDLTENRKLKLLIATSLRYSSHPDLEDFIWNKLDSYNNDFPIYGRLISIFPFIGTKNTINKLENLLSNIQNFDKRRVIEICLEKLHKGVEK